MASSSWVPEKKNKRYEANRSVWEMHTYTIDEGTRLLGSYCKGLRDVGEGQMEGKGGARAGRCYINVTATESNRESSTVNRES